MKAVTSHQWFVSDDVCALCDSERHLAHVIRIEGQWFAFDATHLNGEGIGCAYLGSFARKLTAMDAAESAALHLAGTTVSHLKHPAQSPESPGDGFLPDYQDFFVELVKN